MSMTSWHLYMILRSDDVSTEEISDHQSMDALKLEHITSANGIFQRVRLLVPLIRLKLRDGESAANVQQFTMRNEANVLNSSYLLIMQQQPTLSFILEQKSSIIQHIKQILLICTRLCMTSVQDSSIPRTLCFNIKPHPYQHSYTKTT